MRLTRRLFGFLWFVLSPKKWQTVGKLEVNEQSGLIDAKVVVWLLGLVPAEAMCWNSIVICDIDNYPFVYSVSQECFLTTVWRLPGVKVM